MLKVIHSARFMKIFSVGNMIVWLAMIPLATITRWIDSPAFISYLSIIALFLAAFSAYIGSRVERKQEKEEESNA